jgi:hypothetical protein
MNTVFLDIELCRRYDTVSVWECKAIPSREIPGLLYSQINTKF